MNKTIIAVVVGAVVIVVGYFFLRSAYQPTPSVPQTQSTIKQQVSPTTTQTPATTEQAQVIITYSSSGFSPSTVTVKSGGKITWVNKSDKQVKIGANPHPIHTGNREISGGEFTLDLQPGEEKTVDVSKADAFGYHNHLNASEVGTIIVR